MPIETLTLVPLYRYEPYSQESDELHSPTILAAYMGARPISLNELAPRSGITTVQVPNQPEVETFNRLPLKVGPLDERGLGYRRLVSEITEYRKTAAAAEGPDAWDATRTIERVLEFLDAIPADVPIPKPMLLSGQLALYWDFGDTYAEIDFDETEYVDAYGKRPDMDDVSLDRLQITDNAGRVFFPTELEKVIVGNKG